MKVLAALLTIGQVFALSTELTTSNIEATINDPSKDLFLLAYYDSKCNFCQQFLPVLEEISSVVNQMAVGQIDCTKEESLCSDIKGYPTLKWYRDGEFHAYDGGKDHDDLLSFASTMTSAPVKSFISNKDIFQDDDTSKNVAFILYPTSVASTSTDRSSLFESVARRFQSLAAFAMLESNESNDEWAKSITRQNSKEDHVLMRVERDVGKSSIYGGDWSIPSIAEFVQDNLLTVVPKMTISNVGKLGGNDLYLAIAIVDPERDETPAFLSEFRRYASKALPSIKKEYQFVWLDANKWTSLLERYQVAFSGEPTFLVLDLPYDIYWNLPQDASTSMDEIGQFLKDVTAGDVLSKNANVDESVKENMFTKLPNAELAEFYHNHPWVMMCNVLVSLYVLLLMGSTALPSSSRLHHFMENYYWSRVDKILAFLADDGEASSDAKKDKKD